MGARARREAERGSGPARPAAWVRAGVAAAVLLGADGAAAQAHPVALYVNARSGDDSDTGRSPAQAFRTLARALVEVSAAKPGFPGAHIQVNVRPGDYTATSTGSSFVVPDGTVLESDEGHGAPWPATLHGFDGVPVVVLEPGPLGSELRGFEIRGGSIGVLVPTTDRDGVQHDSRCLIENNRIAGNGGTSPVSWPGMLFRSPAEVGIYVISAADATNAALIRHNTVARNFDGSNPFVTKGTGILSDALDQSTNRSVIEANFLCDHEEDLVLTTHLTGVATNTTLVQSNLICFAEVMVRVFGFAAPRLVHNTIAFGRPSANEFPYVAGVLLAEWAAPVIANNILWVPDPDPYLDEVGRGLTSHVEGLDVVVDSLDRATWYAWSGAVASYTSATRGTNAYHNGVATAALNPPTRYTVPPPLGLYPGAIDFVNSAEAAFTNACALLDLHLVGYASAGVARNPALIDAADPQWPGMAAGPVAVDLDADPRVADGHAGGSASPDFGGDEYAWLRLEFVPVPQTEAPFTMVQPAASFGGILGSYHHTEPVVFLRFAVTDPFHPLASATAVPVLLVNVGESNTPVPGVLSGNLLVPLTGVLAIPYPSFGASYGFPGARGNLAFTEWDFSLQGIALVGSGASLSVMALNRLKLDYSVYDRTAP